MNIAAKHGWNDLENYLYVVQRAVDDHPFVVEHTLSVDSSPEAGEVSGDVVCHGDIILDVRKHYEIRIAGNRKQARTVRYSYHARYKNGNGILRYDNADQRPGHPTRHHKHDWLSGREQISHVGMDWPHLSEVLDEVMKRIWR